MSTQRSSNLTPLTIEDVFDKTPTYAVIKISEEIDYIIQKAAHEGVTANTLFTIFSFYAQTAMDDVKKDAQERVAKRLALKEERVTEAEVNTNVPTV